MLTQGASKSARAYQAIYRNDLVSEAEWLRLGGKNKADSIDLLTLHLQRPFDTLCEIGCGTGALLEECIRRGLARHYIGVDGSEEALDWIRLKHDARIRLIEHDLDAGAHGIAGFADLVVISHVLEHLERPQALLASLRGRCRNLVAEVPLENQPIPRTAAWARHVILGRQRQSSRSGHIQFFTKKSFRQLVSRAGWHIVGERTYLAYDRNTILYSARKYGSPLWRSLAPYFFFKLAGRRVASRLLCVHYAVLALPR